MTTNHTPWSCPGCHHNSWQLYIPDHFLGIVRGTVRAKCRRCKVEVEIKPHADLVMVAERVDGEADA